MKKSDIRRIRRLRERMTEEEVMRHTRYSIGQIRLAMSRPKKMIDPTPEEIAHKTALIRAGVLVIGKQGEVTWKS